MLGTHCRIWSGTARIQSVTATAGPDVLLSTWVTYGTGAGRSGWRSSSRSTATPSRRNSFQLVTDHTSAATSHRSASMSAARSASGIDTPEARIWAVLLRVWVAARYR